MNPIEFGKFVANLRTEKKLTQEDLAEKLYIDKRKISRWECGTSIPDFDTLIKLSEILDVSLYELSICQRLDKEKLSTRAINKLKSIKDLKKYQLKKKLKIILAVILGIFFIITAIYTFKFYGTVEIYEFRSLDEKYGIEGTYIHADDYITFNINKIFFNYNSESVTKNINDCEISIHNNGKRIIYIINTDTFHYINSSLNATKITDDIKKISSIIKSKNLALKVTCHNNDDDYSIKFDFTKIYNNKLF